MLTIKTDSTFAILSLAFYHPLSPHSPPSITNLSLNPHHPHSFTTLTLSLSPRSFAEGNYQPPVSTHGTPRRTVVIALTQACSFLFEFGCSSLGKECAKLAISRYSTCVQVLTNCSLQSLIHQLFPLLLLPPPFPYYRL